MDFLLNLQNNPQYPKNVQISIALFMAIQMLWGKDPSVLSDEEKVVAAFIENGLKDKTSRIRSNASFKPVIYATSKSEKQAAYDNHRLTKELGI